jgi:hypothetical protein
VSGQPILAHRNGVTLPTAGYTAAGGYFCQVHNSGNFRRIFWASFELDFLMNYDIKYRQGDSSENDE